MCKMYISLNKKDDRSYNEMTSFVDKICEESCFVKTGNEEYCLLPDTPPAGALLVLVSYFERYQWIVPNISTWKYIDEDGEEENALATYMRMKKKDNIRDIS